MKISDLGKPVEQTAACLIYAKSSERILLLRRSNLEDQPGEWCMPGGHVENDEKYIDAAKRECAEETAIDLSKNKGYIITKIKTDWPLTIHAVYAFIIDDEVEPTLSWESDAYGWFNLDALPTPLHWTVKNTIANDVAAERLHQYINS